MTYDPPRNGEGRRRAGDDGEDAPLDVALVAASLPRLACGERFRSASRDGSGSVLGIARHDRPRGPIQTVELAEVGLSTGIAGDYRGALKPGRNKRQVTVMTADSWRATMADLRAAISWEQRRVNLLVDGLALAETTGARLAFSGGVVLEVTGECDPCSRMEEVAPGLKAALTPHWRGGVTTRVIAGGRLAIGDAVRIEFG